MGVGPRLNLPRVSVVRNDWHRHKKVKGVFSDREFYRSPEWKELEAECKRRARYRCAECRKSYKNRPGLQAHHVISRSKGGKDALWNLKCLCEDCHSDEHPHMKKALEAKRAKQAKKAMRINL